MSSQKFLSPAWRNGRIRSPTIMILSARSPIRLTSPMYLKSVHAGDLGLRDRAISADALAFSQGSTGSVRVETVIPRVDHREQPAAILGAVGDLAGKRVERRPESVR